MSAHVIGAGKAARDFAVASATIDAKMRAVVRQYGQLLTTFTKAAASGRPGPRRVTGDYLRTITTVMSGNASYSQSTTGTNAPQARRLELGFVGVDSLGRHYNQPPYPHFLPALERVEQPFVNAMALVVRT